MLDTADSASPNLLSPENGVPVGVESVRNHLSANATNQAQPRARDNGITVSLPAKEWKAVRELFWRAPEIPDVRLVWDGLVLEIR
jgi:hypothetical protein